MDFEHFILLENIFLEHSLSRFSNFLQTRSLIKVEVYEIRDIFTLDYLINKLFRFQNLEIEHPAEHFSPSNGKQFIQIRLLDYSKNYTIHN